MIFNLKNSTIFFIFRYFFYRIKVFFIELKENYDQALNTETKKNVAVKNLDPISHLQGAYAYEPTIVSIFNEMLKQVHIPFNEFTFIDIGSGKGRVVMLAANHGFKHIIGIEVCKNLHSTALNNIQLYQNYHHKKLNIDLILKNIIDYQFPCNNLVIYLFNPFDEKIISIIVKKLKLLLIQNNLKIIILYCNPTCDQYIENNLPIRCIQDMKHKSPYGWKIYESIASKTKSL